MGERTWQPIDTAPDDGTDVLLWSAAWAYSWGVQIGHFSGVGWECNEGTVEVGEVDDDGVEIGPTHWCPIPPTPEEEDDAL